MIKHLPPPPMTEAESTCYHATLANSRMWVKTSRSLRLRFQEHTRYIKYNNPQSAYPSQPARVWTRGQNNDPP